MQIATLFFFTILSLSAKAGTLEQALLETEKKQIWNRPEWARLLHYKKTRLGFYESQADSPYFFVSPEGKSDLKAELLANLHALYDSEKRQFPGTRLPAQTVRCQFPARWNWLSQELQISEKDVPAQVCSEYDDFRQKVRAKSATLVFSSYYLNNPSSAFGHSLLRLNKGEGSLGTESHQLLDYGINYAATATTENPVLYALYGLSGFFQGTFTSVPYYYKVREYNDFESRDLWEYDLDLTEQEVRQLVAHIWEMGSTHFDYYYLTENCSFHMLTVLEAAAPRLNLTEDLPFWIIPGDTIKAVADSKGLIKSLHYRPSVRTQLYARLERLQGENEIQAFERSVDERSLASLEPLDPLGQARVLDAAMDYIDYKHGKALLAGEEPIAKWKQSFLVARSRLPTAEALRLLPPENEQPHTGHGSARAQIAYILPQEGSPQVEAGQRFALHDLSDPLQGHPPYAKIEFMNLRFRYETESQDLKLKDIYLFSVDSFSALGRFEKPLSWRMKMGAERIEDLRCDSCLSGVFQLGGGWTVRLTSKPLWTPYLLGTFIFHGSSLFRGSKSTAMIGPVAGMRIGVAERMFLIGELSYLRLFYDEQVDFPKAQLKWNWSPDSIWALTAGTEWSFKGYETSVGLSYYY